MLEDSLIVKLNKNILRRFEHNINDGVLFLFDVETEKLWIGNSSTNDLVKLIDGEKTLKEIYSKLQSVFEDFSYNELKESFDEIIDELIDKEFLKCVSN